MDSREDSPAVGHADWEHADPTDMEFIEGPEQTAIYVDGCYLTEVDTEKWQTTARETYETEWKARAALLERARQVVLEPAEHFDVLQGAFRQRE